MVWYQASRRVEPYYTACDFDSITRLGRVERFANCQQIPKKSGIILVPKQGKKVRWSYLHDPSGDPYIKWALIRLSLTKYGYI